MAESKRVRKSSYKRNVRKERPSDPLLASCLEFVEHNSSLALDDSHDRQRLAEEMVEFIAANGVLCERCQDVILNELRICGNCLRDSDV